MHCKYLEESSCLSSRLSPDDFVGHISYLKRCNRNLSIYEPPDTQLPLQHSILSHFESLLPELVPGNIHLLFRLLSAYLLAWEKDFPFNRLSFRDSDHRFLLLSSPRHSCSVTFQTDESSVLEEQAGKKPSTTEACKLPSPGKTAILLYSLMDSDYPFGFVIRSASGKKTYLLCRELTQVPSPSVTQPIVDSTSFPPPVPTPQQVLIPSDLMINRLTQQLADQNIFSDCSPKADMK